LKFAKSDVFIPSSVPDCINRGSFGTALHSELPAAFIEHLLAIVIAFTRHDEIPTSFAFFKCKVFVTQGGK
jgi:hypothetical protein